MRNVISKDRATLELMLIVVALGMSYLVYEMGPFKMIALNLFFLPIVLSGYYLGRTSAGVLALFCALAVTVAATLNPSGFSGFHNPVLLGLAITVWAAALGLTAILVGTLCDERAAKVNELQEAYVGVVEVLSRYLQSADPRIKARSTRVAELCQAVAQELQFSRKQIDDVRVGALLHDLGNIEITTKLLSKAMDSLESQPAQRNQRHTFLGTDLVQSLGSVLHGAVPLLLSQDDVLHDAQTTGDAPQPAAREVPLGARIIRAVRCYDRLTISDVGESLKTPVAALTQMRRDAGGEYDPDVLDALQAVVERAENLSEAEPAIA